MSEEDKSKLLDDETKKECRRDEEGPNAKKPRLSKKEKKKLRGQNKARPAPYKIPREQQLCNSLIDRQEHDDKKCANTKCKFLHDVKEYLNIKPKDIGKS